MNRRTRRKFSKCASLENANKQLRLLRALQFNKDFIMRPKTKQPGTRSRKNRK